MKLLCKIESDETIDIEDAKIMNVNDNNDFSYTFWNKIRNLKEFYSNEGLDLLYLSLFVFAADRLFLREAANDCWSREIELFVPVLSIDKWIETKDLVEEMLNFLSGDKWTLYFRKRNLSKREETYKERYKKQTTEKSSFDKICMLSGGLDSFIGAINLLESGERDNVLFVSHYGGGKGTKEYQDSLKAQFIEKYGIDEQQFYQNYATVIDGIEDTTRTRSFMFFSHAIVYATAMAKDVTLFIPENGLISLNIPLTHTRLGTSSTRTTHPHYMKRLQLLMNKLGIAISLYNPFQFKTKGEMVAECENTKFLQDNLINTMSCSHPDVGRYQRITKPLHCGYCLPCTIRKAAVLRGELTDTSEYLYSNYHEVNVAKESLKVYKLAIATYDPKLAFLKIQESGPIEDNIMQYTDLYKRGMNELKAYLEESNV